MYKKLKKLLIYSIILLLCGVAIFGATHYFSAEFSMFQITLKTQLQTPVAMLLLQMIAILFVARIFGFLFVKIGQPSVVGEILSGIILGPSVLAHLLPDVSAFLFSPESLGNITILSQIGLIFFMFVIGMELDIVEVKKTFKKTLLISQMGIIFPFLCGILAAYYTYPMYAAQTTPFLSYALFIGISMSVTAFPVLARIIQERGLTKTHLGTLSLASAANGDVSAWCVLAVVIAIAQTGTLVSAIYTILFTVAFLLFMFLVLRPFLNIIGNLYHNKEVLNKTVVAFMLLILICSAYMTEVLGIHALFGAFVAGVVMPSHVQFRKILTEKVEDVSLSIFLPLFFVSTGLKTEIGLISTPQEWWICGGLIFLAVFGKVLGTVLPTRLTGESWKNSWLMGALMNTRGLMELIILTIGYEMGILSPAIFAMLVLMTLVTTFMTAPLLSLIEWAYKGKTAKEKVFKSHGNAFRILLSFGRAGNGKILLNVAQQVFGKGHRQPEVIALHLTVGAELNPIHTESIANISFAPLLEEAELMNFPIKTRYDVTNNAVQHIVQIANQEAFDFLLVGAGISLSALPQDIEATKYAKWFYPGDLMKDKTQQFVEEVRSTVGIFVNRDFEQATEVIVLLKYPKDTFLLHYAENLMAYNQAQIVVSEFGEQIGKNKVAERELREFLIHYPSTTFLPSKQFSDNELAKHNFMLVSYETWKDISENEKAALQAMPSTLIIRKGR